MREELTIFTDGSCYGRHPEKLGGFGTYIQWKDKEYYVRYGYKDTTISRMELRAILYALRAIKKDIRCTATLYSDSKYSVDMIKQKGFEWKQGKINDYENFDLLNEIFREIESHKKLRLKLVWIPGHRKRYDDPIVQGNFIADQLADYKSHSIHLKDNQENSSYLYNSKKKEAYYYHENSDCVFIAPLDGDFGNETEFIHLIGECEKKNVPELRVVCRENNFGWLMNLYDEDKLDIDLR